MSSKRISILGCGWLGTSLAHQLIQQDHFVRGSTTTPENIPLLEEIGVEPYLISLGQELQGDDLHTFVDVDALVLAYPPARGIDKLDEFMTSQMHALATLVNRSTVQQVLMVSSTGVYANRNTDVDEHDDHEPDTPNGRALRAAESHLAKHLACPVTVIRMAGLFGPGRHPGRFLAGRTVSGNGTEPVNMIHQEDAAGILTHLLELPPRSAIYNACAALHPDRKGFYEEAARLGGWDLPRFSDQAPRPWKRILSNRLRSETHYRFVYDNPVDGLQHC